MLRKSGGMGMTQFSAKRISEKQQQILEILILMLFSGYLDKSNENENKPCSNSYARYIKENIRKNINVEIPIPISYEAFEQEVKKQCETLYEVLKFKLFLSSTLTIKTIDNQLSIIITSSDENIIDASKYSFLNFCMTEKIKITFRDDEIQLNGEDFDAVSQCVACLSRKDALCSIS